MTSTSLYRFGILALRGALGWYFLYAGLSKILNPTWSAAGYLNSAETFKGFYGWLASPEMIGLVNVFNEWALFLIGVSLILGVYIKWTAPLGAVMMLLYYFPVLEFPKVGHGFIIDEHIIYAAAFLVLAGQYQANPAWFTRLCKK